MSNLRAVRAGGLFVLCLILWPTTAVSERIWLEKADGSVIWEDLEPFVPFAAHVYADDDGGGLTVAEFRIAGIPEDWTVDGEGELVFASGDPTGGGVTLTSLSCLHATPADPILLYTLTITPRSIVAEQVVTVEAKDPPTSPTYDCPVITGCQWTFPRRCADGGSVTIRSEANLVIDTEALTINGDGASFGGVPFTASIETGVARFVFQGDLTISPDAVVMAEGPNAVALQALNNAVIGAGARFEFSARGVDPGPGGGAGGSGGDPGSGAGGVGGAGGAGGEGGPGSDMIGGVGEDGHHGWTGEAGAFLAGTSGSDGHAGDDGVNAPASGGPGGFGGACGADHTLDHADICDCMYERNCPTWTSNCNEYPPGDFGLCGNCGGLARTNDEGWGGYPGNDVLDPTEIDGTDGTHGLPGLNVGSGLVLAGGGGGGGGGTGGGGSGGAGGGGGGGGAGGDDNILPVPYVTEFLTGGHGGRGGDGGDGGHGWDGLDGTHGGGGGGALEICARGVATLGAHIACAGGDAGTSLVAEMGRNPGCEGLAGEPGGDGDCIGTVGCLLDLEDSYPGGPGGDGGQGGQGGQGGFAGLGGGGAGGTVVLAGSVVDPSATTANMIGGDGGQSVVYMQDFGDSTYTDCGEAGQDGRLVLARNVLGSAAGSVTGATVEELDGPRAANPHLADGTETPYIPDLQGGAEIHGLLDGLTAQDPAFAAVVAGAPADALGALLRLDVGPAGYDHDFTGFDMMLLLNLRNEASPRPRCGVGPARHESDLLIGGYANDARFGGPGFVAYDAMAPYEIYATLVPEGVHQFNASFGDDSGTYGRPLANGDVMYVRDGLVPTYFQSSVATWGDSGVEVAFTLARIDAAFTYVMERRRGEEDFVRLPEAGLVVDGRRLSFLDTTCEPSATYTYRLSALDGGSLMAYGEASLTTPQLAYALHPNRPNPFNPSTTVSFSLPSASNVRLSIYDLSGRLVVRLLDEPMSAGVKSLEWTGRDGRGGPVASGVYILRLETTWGVRSQKLMLAK